MADYARTARTGNGTILTADECIDIVHFLTGYNPEGMDRAVAWVLETREGNPSA